MLKWLGEMRDGLLVTAGIVYVLGYLVWSINAWIHGLGLLPALEFQYFAAGVFPALLIWPVYIGAKYSGLLMGAVATRIGPGAKGRMKHLRSSVRLGFKIVSFTLFILFFVAVFLLRWGESKLLQFATWFCVVAFIVLLPFDHGTRPGYSTRQRVFSWCYILAVLLALMLDVYVFRWYPKLPQALGGLHPRCVYLDAKKMELSSEALEDIFPEDVSRADNEVVRSGKLDLFFSSRDFIWVRRHGKKQGAAHRVYKIKRDIVRAIVSCG